jgi:DNA-binding SARP family transcriptional activator
LELVGAGKPVALGGAKQRAVLALLIMHEPDAVSTDQLVDALWGERPPASAIHAVQVYVSGLRKVLRGVSRSKGASSSASDRASPQAGDAAEIVSLGSAGYRLVVDADCVDARRFERLLEHARTAFRAAGFERAERVLEEALGLWRGPAFADFLFTEFARSGAARLEALRIEASELRMEAQICLGSYAGVITELEALVAEHPLREHTRGLLMRALYGAGRQAEALAVYRSGHRIFSDELGLELGPELRELEQAILLRMGVASSIGASQKCAPAASRGKPLPPGLRGAPRGGYFGRLDQHELLRRWWRTARAGQRECVLVAGEPGIGKTQFMARAAAELHQAGAVILFGRCPEELSAPYAPWIQALSPFVEQADEHILRAYVERHGSELARLIPTVARRVPEAPTPRRSDPELERYLLFCAVVGLLEHASKQSPVALLLDDLHWADLTTLALLKYVVAETRALPLLVLANYRDTELSRDHPLTGTLADLLREERIERLSLSGLGEDEVVLLVEAFCGEQPRGVRVALAGAITEETGGNPFFVGEMLRHLTESGALVRVGGGSDTFMPDLAELGLPQSVRDVVLSRVERLGDDSYPVLGCASVIGPQFSFALLARVLRADDDKLIDILSRAAGANLVEEDSSGAFSFAHDLISHVLYESLGASRRSRLHRRIAEAIEELSGDDRGAQIEQLARHWIAASASDLATARSYCIEAGELALEKLAPDESVRWFAQALDLLEASPNADRAERCELKTLLGEAQRQSGRAEFRETLLEAAALADEAHDAKRIARAALANSRGFASSFGVVDRERVAVLERAVALNGSTNPSVSARLRSLQAMELQFDADHGRRRALANEALALARAASDVRSLPYVLRDHFHATWSADTLDARRRTAAELMQLARVSDDPLVRMWALDRNVHVQIESGTLVSAAETLALLQGYTEQIGQPGLRWHGAYYAAGLAHLQGDIERSELLAESAARLGGHGGEPDTGVIYFGQIAMVRIEQGRGNEIVHVIERVAAENPGVSAYQAALAAVLCDLERYRDAAPLLATRADRGFASIPRDQIFLAALALWAIVTADLQSERDASVLYDLIEPWRDQLIWTGAMGYGSAESYLGMLATTLGSYERAREHFAAASRLHQREAVTVWEARNLCHWAASLLAVGAGDDALAIADRALTLARENRYAMSAQRAAKLRETAMSQLTT